MYLGPIDGKTTLLSIALNVKNIADNEYLTLCLARGDYFPSLRRTVRGTVRFSFWLESAVKVVRNNKEV